MKQFIKSINWKKIGIGLLIAYALFWSYLYLAIKFAEHEQNNFSIFVSGCAKMTGMEAQTICLNSLEDYRIKPKWLFIPVLVNFFGK
jgi:hypothetical protein